VGRLEGHTVLAMRIGFAAGLIETGFDLQDQLGILGITKTATHIAERFVEQLTLLGRQ